MLLIVMLLLGYGAEYSELSPDILLHQYTEKRPFLSKEPCTQCVNYPNRPYATS